MLAQRLKRSVRFLKYLPNISQDHIGSLIPMLADILSLRLGNEWRMIHSFCGNMNVLSLPMNLVIP